MNCQIAILRIIRLNVVFGTFISYSLWKQDKPLFYTYLDAFLARKVVLLNFGRKYQVLGQLCFCIYKF